MSGRLFSAFLLGAASVVGCSAVGEPGDFDAWAAGDPGAGPAVEGHAYRVPVPEELEPWSTYPVDFIEAKRDDDILKFEYTFPRWLVGAGQMVELEGVYRPGDASFAVYGLLGSGECVVTGSHFECTEHLPGVVIDHAEAEASMEAAGLPAGDVSQRLRVTEVFSVDPIGIIEFDLP